MTGGAAGGAHVGGGGRGGRLSAPGLEQEQSGQDQARRQGYVQTLLGRKRSIPELHAANPSLRGAGERAFCAGADLKERTAAGGNPAASSSGPASARRVLANPAVTTAVFVTEPKSAFGNVTS